MKLSNRQQLNHLPQLRCRLAVVTRRHPLIHEGTGVADLRLDVGVREPVAVSCELRDATHEVPVRVAGLPVVGVVNADHRADVPVKVAAFGGLFHGSVVRLDEIDLAHSPSDIDQLVSVPAHQAEEVAAVIINLRLNVLEIELGEAPLAFDHESLQSDRGIEETRSRVELHHDGHLAWKLQHHQYISVFAFCANEVKAIFINIWSRLFELNRSLAPFAFEHCRLRVNQEIVA